MGTITGLLLILLLIIYPPYMLIKWAKRGSGLFFPNWNKMNREHQRVSSFYPDMTTFYGKFSYYFLLAWTIGEILLFVFIVFNK